MYVIASNLEFNYTTSLVRRSVFLVRTSQGSLDFWDLYFSHSDSKITYMIAYYLRLSYFVTFTLAIPTYISVRG